MQTPEALARQDIDRTLAAAGWVVQNPKVINLFAGQGVAVREFPLAQGHGFADYLLFVDQKAVGVIEAKKQGATLTGVEGQAEKYGDGLPTTLKAPVKPLPFLYQSTGIETRFTNGLDPDPRSRPIFAFHTPQTLAEWVNVRSTATIGRGIGDERASYDVGNRSTLRSRLREMPPLLTGGLWPAQIEAVRNLEKSLAEDRPRSLVQMATGSGKTFTAVTSIYRMVKFGGAKRGLFLVDRGNLGRQTLKEFQQYTTPDDGRKFTELYNVQHLQSNKIDPVARVCICTIQRLFSMLRGDAELDPALEEESLFEPGKGLIDDRKPLEIGYNPAIPIETFDVIFTDEAHRSIYNLWRQVLEYFDAYLIGLTATPSKQTFGFFNGNLVMEYGHQQAVADGVNVGYDIYRIRTAITEGGGTVEAGIAIDKRDRLTRKTRWEELDEDLTYTASQLDRDVVSHDQIRTVIQTFRDRLPEIFPGRTEVPKTLFFAKDDSHADDIVQIIREEFGRGNDFCQKITYRTTGQKPEDLLQSFRNSYNPRIVVTVDMIATGTDIKPLEIVVFMRSVKSRNFYEQMKGRGVRVIDRTSLRAVTPDAESKDHFVLVDCVGVTEAIMTDAPPLERKYSVSFGSLMQQVAFGSTELDVVSSLADRLARLDRQLSKPDQAQVTTAAGGTTLTELVGVLVAALDPDRHREEARIAYGLHHDEEPTGEQLEAARDEVIARATRPLASSPALREALESVKRNHEQTIDKVTQDEVLEAGFTQDAGDRAAATIASWRQYIEDNRDDITAFQVLYSQPFGSRLRHHDLKELAQAIKAPPRSWTPDSLWQAYEAVGKSNGRRSGQRSLTDLVSLIRYTMEQEAELVPFEDKVAVRFDAWLVAQEAGGRRFTDEQRRWLLAIRDHVATSLRIEPDDFEEVPFSQRGGLGRVYELFGDDLTPLLDELNEVLVA